MREIEDARVLMTEAMDWSVVKWLREKKRVRRTADKANATFDALKLQARAAWSEPLRAAYNNSSANPDLAAFVERVKHAEEDARRARQEAEAIFDEAERQLSTRLAREGCRKALHQWDLDEKATRLAESGPR